MLNDKSISPVIHCYIFIYADAINIAKLFLENVANMNAPPGGACTLLSCVAGHDHL